jgi:hypothetical protein
VCYPSIIYATSDYRMYMAFYLRDIWYTRNQIQDKSGSIYTICIDQTKTIRLPPNRIILWLLAMIKPGNLKFLDSPRCGRKKRKSLIFPNLTRLFKGALVNSTKTSFSNKAIRSEIFCGGCEFPECECLCGNVAIVVHCIWLGWTISYRACCTYPSKSFSISKHFFSTCNYNHLKSNV